MLPQDKLAAGRLLLTPFLAPNLISIWKACTRNNKKKCSEIPSYLCHSQGRTQIHIEYWMDSHVSRLSPAFRRLEYVLQTMDSWTEPGEWGYSDFRFCVYKLSCTHMPQGRALSHAAIEFYNATFPFCQLNLHDDGQLFSQALYVVFISTHVHV